MGGTRLLQPRAQYAKGGKNGYVPIRGRFPQDFKEILSLSGIGEYTAGAIASFAFDLPYPAVDGNVLRVAARLLNDDGDILSPATKKALTAAVWAAQPQEDAATYNQAMIELGATVCLPNGVPKCEHCPLAAVCAARAAGREQLLPVRKKAAPRRIEMRTVLILREGDTIALRQRPASGLLASLFEPITLSEHLDADALRARLATVGVTPLRILPLGEAKHIFTHLEWHMVGFEIDLDEKSAQTVCEKLEKDAFFARRDEIDERYALPSAYSAYRSFM